MNFSDAAPATELGLTADRWGGNSTSRYNYTNNTHNTGSDYYFENIVDSTSLEPRPGMIVRVTELPTASTHLLSVSDVVDVGPRMRRITVAGDALAGFVALPGQDVVVHVSDGHGGGVSRRYTIRNLDTAGRRLDLDVVMHGHGPGAGWASSVAIGDGVEVFGPRGKVLLAAAGWQVFAGDEAAIPAIAEMIAALPAGTAAVAVIEVADAHDEQPIATTELIDVRWLHRGTTPPGESDLLDRALASIEIPDADRHAYLFGESRVVRRLRDDLGGRGLQPHEISAKGYWNLGRASGH